MTAPLEPQALEAALRAALSGLALPDGGVLGESRRLGDVSRDASGRLSFSIAVAPEEAPRFEAIRAEAEALAARLPGVARALALLTAERSAPPKLSAPKTVRKAAPLAEVGAVIAVASGKGGVGKSTVTANLALALRQKGLKIGILDADVYGPSIPTLLGLHGKPQMSPDGRRLKPLTGWGISAMSVGLLVDPETAMIWRGPMILSAITQLIAEVDWGALDLLLVDMPPGTGDAQLAVAQGSPLKGAVIVSTPQDLALIDARRGVAMFRKLDVPILGLIENMSQFICPDCGSSHAIFGHGGARAEAGRIGAPWLGALPLTMALRASADLGRPLLATDPEGEVGRAMGAIADRLLANLKERGLR